MPIIEIKVPINEFFSLQIFSFENVNDLYYMTYISINYISPASIYEDCKRISILIKRLEGQKSSSLVFVRLYSQRRANKHH